MHCSKICHRYVKHFVMDGFETVLILVFVTISERKRWGVGCGKPGAPWTFHWPLLIGEKETERKKNPNHGRVFSLNLWNGT